MEIVECILKDGMIVRKDNDSAIDFEKDIAIIHESTDYDFAFSVRCDRFYNKTERFKILYPDKYHDFVWMYINRIKGLLVSENKNFDEVMNDEGLSDALGNVRINRIIFELKTTTNGKYCEPCQC